MKWWVYIVRCGDGSYYTGISTNVTHRVHLHRIGRGARYTRGRSPLDLGWTAGPYEKSEALREERRIKRLSHRQKEELVSGHEGP